MGRLSDGEREVLAEQERDARETEEAGEWERCEECQGTGYDLVTFPTTATTVCVGARICQKCLGLGSWRIFG